VVTKLVLGFGMFPWRELFSGKVCGCVPGLLRTGSPVVPNRFSQNNEVLELYKLFAKTFLKMNPCMSNCVANKPYPNP
jgi:hypothetical protein